MTKFDDSLWADTDFSKGFREDADIFLPFRRQFIDAAKSLYGYFLTRDSEAGILDLGCGDGLFIQELLKSFSPGNITLVDGSSEMLVAANKRLHNVPNIDYLQIDFQKLILEQPLTKRFDFIYSSLAIHHLPYSEKCKLYAYIYSLLKKDGCFVHYDVVLFSSEKNEAWYMSHWRDWIDHYPDRERGRKLLGIPDDYKQNRDNLPDTLESQLQALKEIGFRDVDCFFKHGIFSLFGGCK